jgi:hypothetical protein
VPNHKRHANGPRLNCRCLATWRHAATVFQRKALLRLY